MPEKPSLILLHGALGCARQMHSLASALQDHFRVHSFTFAGHGGKEDLPDPFSIERFAGELEAWLQIHQFTAVPVFGYSMGGYVALYLASRQPAYFAQILTLGTKFAWSAASAARETSMLQPAVVAEKVPRLAQALAERHHPLDWRLVMEKTAAMMLRLGAKPLLTPEQLAKIQLPVTIMRGSEDRMVSEAESRQAASSLPQGCLLQLQGQPHPLEQLDLDLLARQLISLLLMTDKPNGSSIQSNESR